MPLNPRQKRFVEAYLVDPNAKQAAIAAGYSAKTAETAGPRLYRNVQVRAEIDKRNEKRADKAGIKAETVIAELVRFALLDIGKAFRPDGTLLPLHEMPEDVRRAISGFETEELYEGADGEKFSLGKVRKVKFWDKTKGLELLGRHLKMWTDKVEHSGKVTLEQMIAMAGQSK